jgi:hypothetical protein
MSKGQETELKWTIPNIFRDGSYTISLAVHGYGGLPVYDWWDNALQFEVAAGRQSPYAIAPAITVKATTK